jgi:hypothetical protein
VLDNTGKFTNRGEWLPHHKWNVRKGHLKIHVVAVDIKKKRIVSLDVTSQEVHDGWRQQKQYYSHLSKGCLKNMYQQGVSKHGKRNVSKGSII